MDKSCTEEGQENEESELKRRSSLAGPCRSADLTVDIKNENYVQDGTPLS
jgi:hypothetical protein